MTATRLVARRIEKVWGQRDLPPGFGTVADDAEPIGEIHFEDPRGGRPELLVKYLFTAERLSIQVHPGDEAAQALGHPCGKDEAWLVVSAEPNAEIAIGLRHAVAKDELRAAALDGRIEKLVDWRRAQAGDSYYSPAGTVHAIGPGLTLVEIQQNCDVTFRLYDYGRPRELHLDAAIEAAAPVPYQPPHHPYIVAEAREILAAGSAFVLERWQRSGSGWLEAEPGVRSGSFRCAAAAPSTARCSSPAPPGWSRTKPRLPSPRAPTCSSPIPARACSVSRRSVSIRRGWRRCSAGAIATRRCARRVRSAAPSRATRR
jgi:mannose-6-phosphate isomerase